MQNIDKKVTLILKLNAKVKRLELALLSQGNSNINPVLKKLNDDIKRRKSLFENVLTNLNYLNY